MGTNTEGAREAAAFGEVGHIVVAVDGSDTARAALRWAATEARSRGASLSVVHVYQPMSAAYPYQTLDGGALRQQVEEETRQGAQELLDGVVAEVPELEALGAEVEVRRGRPSTEILEAAERAHLIVLGTRGLGGFRGMLLGSVGQSVVAQSTIPVVLVPQP
ncbi:universal stress protein [Egibacter rhizosphaerae]|nr:universal stress protein [Egibacter rhizosphaerae]